MGMLGNALLVILGLCDAVSSIRIGAFNVQDFGQKKLQSTVSHSGTNISVQTVLFEIIRRYDIVLIQEISMDDNNFHSFIMRLNTYVHGNSNPGYAYVISPYLGTGNDNRGKEKYAYIYNTRKIQIQGNMVFSNNPNHVNFDRPPYIVAVRDLTPGHAVKPFYLVGLHARPCNCIYEMMRLEKVYGWLRSSNPPFPSYDRVIFLGDFNAGCSYFKEGVDEHKVPFLYSNTELRHLITGITNIAEKDKCPYDKMVASKCIFSRDTLLHNQIFNFSSALFHLTPLPTKESRKVSDHYPIEVELTAKPNAPPPLGCVNP